METSTFCVLIKEGRENKIIVLKKDSLRVWEARQE